MTSDMDDLLQSTDIGTIFLDRSLRVRNFTPLITRLIGLVPHDVGRSIESLTVQLDLPDLMDLAREALEKGASSERDLHDIRGSWRRVRINPCCASGGEIDGVVITVIDIDRIRSTDITEVRLANEALQAANEELRQFAYIASHDLQSPLRTIAGFSDFLREEYRGKLDERADDYIDRIIRAVTRMQKMIGGLLQYSRLDSSAEPAAPIELDQEINEVLSEMSAAIEEVGAIVTHDKLPTIRGDRAQISQVLRNLIENGIKYRGDNPPAVHISAEQQDGRWTFRVRDNGIGIAPEHQAQVFELFRRLHGQSKYSGTGMGLSICKRIVQRHGGRIWVESAEGQGSTFAFTVPLEPELPRPRVPSGNGEPHGC